MSQFAWANNPKLWLAVNRGRTEEAMELLQSGVNIEEKGWDFWYSTPLQNAARRSTPDMVRLLLEWNADISVGTDRKPILHWVTDKLCKITGDGEKVKILIDHGADVNSMDYFGMTPLHHAAFNGNLSAVKVLIANRANVLTKSYDRHSAESLASLNNYGNNNDEIVFILKEQALIIEKRYTFAVASHSEKKNHYIHQLPVEIFENIIHHIRLTNL